MEEITVGKKMPVVQISFTPKKNFDPQNDVNPYNDPRWYTVVTKFNYEKKYASDIIKGLRNSGMDAYISEVVVPIREYEETVERMGKRRTVIKEDKIYPAYVFVRTIMNEYVWNYLRNLTGAATILATRGSPSYMTDEEMLKIKEVCGILDKERQVEKENLLRNLEELRRVYTIGKLVKITDGLFKGMEGNITAVDFQRQKLQISLTINGISVEVNLDNVEA